MRYLMMISGAVLLLVGLLSMVTPIPGGVLAITVGAGMILCASPAATAYLKACRIKYARLNKYVSWIENKMGERLSKALRQTRPDENAADMKTCDSQ